MEVIKYSRAEKNAINEQKLRKLENYINWELKGTGYRDVAKATDITLEKKSSKIIKPIY